MPRPSRSNVAVITFNDIPTVNHTFKYDVLGRMAIENRRQYCERHGYDFICDVPIARDRPACWAKIPAILEAFRTHEWVLWADSDALVFNQGQKAEPLCDPAYDLIVQTHERHYQLLGIPMVEGVRRMPINTGVFLIRASAWADDFLRRAYERIEYVSHGEVWNGIGEQEAMIALLQRVPEDLKRIKHVDGLQAPPRFYRPGFLFMHFYGNHARHRIPPRECEAVLRQWHRAVQRSEPMPPDFARFHWCCIQNKSPENPIAGGDLATYLYRPDDIMAHPQA